MIMPYADPEKKRAYMKKYNREWYSENKEPRKLVERNVNRKRNLRSAKIEHIVQSLGEYCPACGATESGEIKLHIIGKDGALKGKPISDLSWPQVRMLLGNGVLSLICSVCKYKGKPEDSHGRSEE